MGAALALATRGRGRTAPNPNVGCVIVRDGIVVGRGWTQPGGRPHAEAVALAEAGEKSRGATCYTTLEPCAHVSSRGPACSDLLIAAGVARVVIATNDPDPRTNGNGAARLCAASITADVGCAAAAARWTMGGFLTRVARGRPTVTLKLAISLDGCFARADGESRWITGPASRAHAHLERARHEAILVGRGTLAADAPMLDVRLGGLADRTPRRIVLTRGTPPTGWEGIAEPGAIAALAGVNDLLVEGGAQTAAAFLAADLVDRLLLYRAPILVGGGMALGDIGLESLGEAHGRWRLHDARALGSDRLEVYERVRDKRMFTGIITDIGRIASVTVHGDTRLVIETGYDTATIDLGASISCSGVCLTVIDKSPPGTPGWFAVDVSGETIGCTAHGQWSVGRRLNLERALKMGDELGGHIVTGHVDGIGAVMAIAPEGGSHRIDVCSPADIAPYIAAKGSITVDGVSLTVNSVTDDADGSAVFGLNIIPHTWQVTAFGDLAVGQAVNLEIDVLARYLARMRDRLTIS